MDSSINQANVPAPVGDPNQVASVLAAIVLGTVGVLSFIIQPGLVQAFVGELGLTEPEAVNLAGAEMAGVALVTIGLALLPSASNWRLVVAAGLTLAALGNLITAFALESDTLGFARFLAGLGHGAIISISFTLVGATRANERNIAFYLILLLTYGAFGLWYLPSIVGAFGLAPVFISFAVICILSMVTSLLIPSGHMPTAETNPTARQLSGKWILIALAGVLAYNLAQGIAWAVLFLVGIGASFAEQAVADALFVSQVCAIFGALASVFLANRIASSAAIAIGIFGGAASIGLLIGVGDYSVFLAAVCGFNALWNFVLPFILSKVCEFEQNGQMMARAVALQMVGLGIGPFLAAPLISDDGFQAVLLVCVGLFLASYLLLLGPMRTHRNLLLADSQFSKSNI